MHLNMKKRFLTDEEEKMIVRVLSKFADLGYPVTRNSVLEVINDIIERKLERVGVGSTSKVSTSFVNKVIRRNKELAGFVKSCGIDIQRADQISEEVRDALFAKLDIYARILVKMGVFGDEIKSFGDISPTQIYNSDEVALNSTKRVRKKVLCSKKGKKENRKKLKKLMQSPVWKRTFEGDGKMNRHVSYMITSRADGKLTRMYNLYLYFSKVMTNY